MRILYEQMCVKVYLKVGQSGFKEFNFFGSIKF